MKHIKKYVLVLICLLGCFFVSCEQLNNEMQTGDSNSPSIFSVTFILEGKTYHTNVVDKGNTVAKPIKNPTKSNHKFVGWSIDENGEELYKFSEPVTKSLRLYAKFELDTEALQANIQDKKYSIVKINNKLYNLDGETETDVRLENGVGFVFQISNGYCFIITNNHTIAKQEGYDNQKVTVEDYKGNVYDAYYYKNPNKANRASSNEYDLALICFEYNEADLKAISMKDNITSVEGDVVALGTNVDMVAYGIASRYDTVESAMEEYLSDVKYKVIHHNAIIENEEESLLFDLEMSLLGITYQTVDGVAYTIPTSKITEFLYEYVYN